MKFSTIISLVTAIVGASAADLDGLPSCATTCITALGGDSTAGSFAGCKQLDIKCVCSNSDWINQLSCCIFEKCSGDDQQTAVDYARQICSTAGVVTPDHASCSNSTSAAPTSAAPTSAASSSATAGPSGSSKSAANSTTTAASSKPTSGASSVLLSAGSVLGLAAAVFFVAL